MDEIKSLLIEWNERMSHMESRLGNMEEILANREIMFQRQQETLDRLARLSERQEKLLAKLEANHVVMAQQDAAYRQEFLTYMSRMEGIHRDIKDMLRHNTERINRLEGDIS